MEKLISRQIQLKSRPEGVPGKDDFQIAEVEIGEPRDGELLVKNLWLSVDHYMWGRMEEQGSFLKPYSIGEALEGACVGVVVMSRHVDFPAGSHVLGDKGGGIFGFPTARMWI